MITSTPRFALPPLALVAALALAACGDKAAPTNAVVDPMAENAVTPAVPVELPPAITSSKSYRCKDNSVVQVDRFRGDKQASVKTATSPAVTLRGEAGQELTAEGGYALTFKGETLSLTLPGKAKQACKG